MTERNETSPPVYLCAGWGLNLAARLRQCMLPCSLLRSVTPFLALGGRYLPQSVAARSLGLLTAMPWLAPRWLEWPEQDTTSPAHANEQVMRPPRATTPGVASPSAPNHPQQQAQPPIALALTLHSACAGLGKPGCGRVNPPALVLPFSGELRSAAPASPAPAETVAHQVRMRGEIAYTGMGAFPQPRVQPQMLPSHSDMARQTDTLSVPEAKTGKQSLPGAGEEEAGVMPVSGRFHGTMPSRLPKITPLWGPLGGFRGLTPGTSPAAFYRIAITAAPGHRAKQAGLLFQSPPEAVDTPEMPPLPEHKLHGGPGTVAPAVSLQGLSLALETIRHTMKREVAAAIREREEKAQSFAVNRGSGPDMTTAENLVSDNFVRLFMQKMRKLAEEERFRLGLLR